MKFKNLLISIAIVSASASASADAGALVVGIILGSALTQPNSYNRPIYVQQPPQVIYQQAPVVINPSQVPYYDPNLHGYCAPYSDELYARCVGNAKRNQMNDAYQRGFRGY